MAKAQPTTTTKPEQESPIRTVSRWALNCYGASDRLMDHPALKAKPGVCGSESARLDAECILSDGALSAYDFIMSQVAMDLPDAAAQLMVARVHLDCLLTAVEGSTHRRLETLDFALASVLAVVAEAAGIEVDGHELSHPSDKRSRLVTAMREVNPLGGEGTS